jgi:glycosyltransferase 2 family protein
MGKLLRLSVSVALLAWIALRVNWADVGGAFTRVHALYWLAAVGLLLLAQLASAKRWQLFARELDFDRSLLQLFGYYLIGMCFNLVLPTSVGGDVVRVWYLDGGSKRRLAAFGAVLLERVNGLLVLIALACVATYLVPLELPWWVPATTWGIGAGAVLGLASMPLLARWSRLPLPRRQQLRTVLDTLHHPRALPGATVLSVFVQIANIVAVWILGTALGANVPFGYYCILVPMVSLLTLLPVSLNGMGVREGGVLLFLTPLGVAEETALTLSFMWFAIQMAVSLLGGVVYLCGAFPRPGTKSGAETEDENGPVGSDSDQGREGQFGQAA